MSKEKAELIELKRQIGKIQASFAAWNDACIPEKTLLVLLSLSTKIPEKTIAAVIDGMENLEADYFTVE